MFILGSVVFSDRPPVRAHTCTPGSHMACLVFRSRPPPSYLSPQPVRYENWLTPDQGN